MPRDVPSTLEPWTKLTFFKRTPTAARLRSCACHPPSASPSCSSTVGSRARAARGAAVGIASRSRTASTASRAVTLPHTRRLPWHVGHSKTSIENVRRKSVAQSTRDVAAYSAPPRSRSQWRTLRTFGASHSARAPGAGAETAGDGLSQRSSAAHGAVLPPAERRSFANARTSLRGTSGAGVRASARPPPFVSACDSHDVEPPSARSFGTTSFRHADRGAITPLYLTSGWRGGGINAARRASRSIDVITRCFARPPRAYFTRYAKRPPGSRRRRSSESARRAPYRHKRSRPTSSPASMRTPA
jgi:hypothetical protein